MRVRDSLAACLLVASLATGQAAAEGGDERPWTIGATAYAYFVPDEPDFVMAVVPADVRLLHVEARYNYEAVRSGAAFVGLNLRGGRELRIAFTPMFGGVAGDLDGLVPALRLTLAWWKLDLSSESEIVVSFGDSASSFFYNWSELGVSPVPWLRVGAALQRMHVVQTPLAIQRGLFVSGTFRFVTLALYEFNLGWTTPTWVLATSVAF